jgi:hypothetical protein
MNTTDVDPDFAASTQQKTATTKLSVLQDRFQGFEKQMEQETKHRRELEENKFNAIRDQMGKLEKTLNSEIKRRVEANKALQAMFESQIATVQEKLECVFVERLDQIQATCDSLNDRMAVVERDFSLEREKYIRDIEEKNAVVARDVAALQMSFEQEKAARTERENQIVKRLGDLEYRTEQKFGQQMALREQTYGQMREELEDSKRMREKGDEKFQTFILEEVAALKNGLVIESQSRETADDDIVKALNHYTKALQEALRIVSTS